MIYQNPYWPHKMHGYGEDTMNWLNQPLVSGQSGALGMIDRGHLAMLVAGYLLGRMM